MNFAIKIKTLREQAQLPQRKVAAALDIDTATYCRIENGSRFASRKQMEQLSDIFRVEQQEMRVIWLADQVTKLLKDDSQLSADVFQMANEQLTTKQQ